MRANDFFFEEPNEIIFGCRRKTRDVIVIPRNNHEDYAVVKNDHQGTQTSISGIGDNGEKSKIFALSLRLH